MPEMNLFGGAMDRHSDAEKLETLTEGLIDILQKMNHIRPVQFLDFESDYVYNFLDVVESLTDDRIYIRVSGRYDNLPDHEDNPLKNSRGAPMLPYKDAPAPDSDLSGEML